MTQAMKHLMDQKISNYFGVNTIDFPIRENANIYNANALRLNWNTFTENKLDYIFGNPPFIGAVYQTTEQKEDMRTIFGKKTKLKNLDYVSCWFIKAMELMNENKWVKTAFVSTNSITQGEQVETLWKSLLENNIKIKLIFGLISYCFFLV